MFRQLGQNVSRKFEVRKTIHNEELAAACAAGDAAPVDDGTVISLMGKPCVNRLK